MFVIIFPKTKIKSAFKYKHLNSFEIFSLSQQDLGGVGETNSIESLSLGKINHEVIRRVDP